MATYNLFSAVTGPPTTVTGNQFSLSTEFAPTQTVWLTQLRYYKASTANYGAPTGQLFTVTTGTTGSAVSGTAATFPTAGSGVAAGWQTVTLATPVQLTAGQRYRVIINYANAAYPNNNYPQTAGYFNAGGPGATTTTTGPLTLYSNAGATGQIQGGSIVSSGSVLYTNASGGACHWSDVTVTDVNPFATAWTQTVTDSAGAADTAAAGQGYARAVADAAGAADNSAQSAAYAPAVTDNAGGAANISQAAVYAPTLSDAADASDTNVAGLGAYRAANDAIDVADLTGQAASYTPVLDDNAGAAETLQTAETEHTALTDAAGVTDTASTAVDYVSAVPDDSISAADDAFYAVGVENQVQVPDDIAGAADAAVSAAHYTQTVDDAAGVDENLLVADAEGAVLTDPAGADDDVTSAATSQRAVTDPAGVADTATYVVGHTHTGTFTDTAGASDKVTSKITAEPPIPVTAAAETDTAFPLPATPTATRAASETVDTQTAQAIPRPIASANAAQAAADNDSALVLQPTGSYPTETAVDLETALPLVVLVDDPTFAAAIEDVDRTPTFTLRADWSRDGNYDHELSDLTDLVADISITRDLAGELPAEVGLVEGYSAATMTVHLAGQWDTAGSDGITAPNTTGVDPVSAFAPYNPDAPLFAYPTIGTPITCDLGFLTATGQSLLRRFTGTVSKINPSSANRDVQIDALDAADTVRAPITQAPVGLDAIMLASFGEQSYFARYNSQWLIDRILRANGIYASPPPSPEAFLSVTMHGSQVPEIGGGGVPQQYAAGSPATTQAWINTGHPFGMLYPNPAAPAPVGSWYADVRLTMGANSGFGWSGWVYMPDSAYSGFLWGIVLNADQADSSQNYQVSVEIDSGVPGMLVYTPTEGAQGVGPVSTWTIPTVPKWIYLGCHWQFVTGGVNMTMNVNGRVYYPPTIPITVGSPSWQPTTTVYYELDVPVTNMSWWQDPLPPEAWTGQTWIPQADIDPGLNELTGIPELVGEDSWSLLTEIVEAESATCGFTPEGRFWFHSRAVTRPRGTAETVTAQRELADMVTTTDEAGVRNSISSTLTPLLIGNSQWVVNSTDSNLFQSGPGTSYFNVTLPSGVVLADPPFICNFYTTDGFNQLSDTYPYTEYMCIAAVNFFNQTALIADTAFQIELFRKDSATLTIAVFNQSGVTIVFKTPDVITDNGDGTTSTTAGVPAFKIPGRVLAAQGAAPQVISDPGSIATYGPRTYELGNSGGSRWLQYPPAVQGIAEGILAATGFPVPVLDAVTVPHDPRRQLGDAITVADPYGLGTVTGVITGITTTFTSNAAAEDQLTVRPLAPPGYGLWDDPDLGRIGQTLRFGP